MRKWPQKKLGELVSLEYGKALKAEERSENGRYPVYGSNGIVGSFDEAVVKHPTIVVGRKGAIGEAHLALNGCWPIDTAFYTVLRQPGIISLPFLLLWFRSVNLKSLAITATIPGLNRDTLYAQKVPLPPPYEQERVVKLLDEVDELCKLREQADKRSAELIPALFEEMFGDPVNNSKSWPRYSLSELSNGKTGIKAGPFGSSLKKECYTSDGPRVYGQEQVIVGDFSIGDYHISDQKYTEMSAYTISPGDVLISLVGTIGKVVVVPHGVEKGIINPRLVRIRPMPEKIHSCFLEHLLTDRRVTSFLTSLANGITMGVLNAGILKKLTVFLPPLELQTEFASRVSEIRALATSQSSSRKNLDALFQSMLHRAFEGEL